MPEFSSCPACRQQVRVPDELAGKRVRCPSCGETFVAADDYMGQGEKPVPPMARRDRDEPSPYDDDRDYDYPDRRRRRDGFDKAHRGGAILAMGIISLVTAILCALVGLILGIIAWSMGANDLREMAKGRMDPSGEGNTRGGMICGIIGTILAALNMTLGIILMLTGAPKF